MATVGQRVSEAETALSVHCNISACFQHLFFCSMTHGEGLGFLPAVLSLGNPIFGVVRVVQSDMKVLAKYRFVQS